MTHQQIIIKLAGIRDGLVKGCKCGGSGRKKIARIDYARLFKENGFPLTGGMIADNIPDTIPCPSCAELRGLELDKRACRDFPYAQTKPCQNRPCETCDYFKPIGPPDLTIHRQGSKLWIIHVMQVLGEWEGFVEWVWVDDYRRKLSHKLETADILTDGEKLVPAISAYLEGVE